MPHYSDLRSYQIRVLGHLGEQWSEWFDGFSITFSSQGESLLTGPPIDQAALYGLLKRIRDLGIPLISVCPINQNKS